MPNLLDLPPEIRARALARIGLTEDEYREQNAQREAAAQAASQEPFTPESQAAVADKFKDIPAGVVTSD